MKPAVMIGVVLVAVFTGSVGQGAESQNPFGFETQTHPLQHSYCRKADNPIRDHHLYICTSAPRAHPDFFRYDLNFLEGVGLCDISSFTYGRYLPLRDTRLDNFMEKLKKQLSKKYGSGRPDKSSGKKRVYIWDKKAGFNGVGNVEQIRMQPWAQTHSAGTKSAYTAMGVNVYFHLKTMTLCEEKLYNQGSQAF